MESTHAAVSQPRLPTKSFTGFPLPISRSRYDSGVLLPQRMVHKFSPPYFCPVDIPSYNTCLLLPTSISSYHTPLSPPVFPVHHPLLLLSHHCPLLPRSFFFFLSPFLFLNHPPFIYKAPFLLPPVSLPLFSVYRTHTSCMRCIMEFFSPSDSPAFCLDAQKHEGQVQSPIYTPVKYIKDQFSILFLIILSIYCIFIFG